MASQNEVWFRLQIEYAQEHMRCTNKSCSFMGTDFDGEHMCSEAHHLEAIFRAIRSHLPIIQVSSRAFGWLIPADSENPEVLVCIDAEFTMVIGGPGQGFSAHPLTRVLGWAYLFHLQPNLESIFPFFRAQLNSDLIRMRFGTVARSTPQEMVENWSMRVCLTCLNRRALRCCRERPFRFHLLLLGVFQNGWRHGDLPVKSWVGYRGRKYPIVYQDECISFRGCEYRSSVVDTVLAYASSL